MVSRSLIGVAQAVADAARPVPLKYFRRNLAIEDKADASPVTVADKETERAMRAVLAEKVPDHGIFGEEHGRSGLDRRYVWVLDPIDGTRSFITGFPLFCSLTALLEDGIPILGIVDVPAIGERYMGVAGDRAWFGDRLLRTSEVTDLSQAQVYVAGHEPVDEHLREGFNRAARAGRMQRYCYDAYAYALVAAGHVDVMFETDLEPYDYLSLVPLIEAAGGRISDWSGRPLRLDSKGDVLACATPQLHDAMLGLLNEH